MESDKHLREIIDVQMLNPVRATVWLNIPPFIIRLLLSIIEWGVDSGGCEEAALASLSFYNVVQQFKLSIQK
jgi:hypothetical protein